MFSKRRLILSAFLLAASHQAAAVTVGGEANCDFHTLNDAINSVPRGGTVSIRLSNNMQHDPLLSIDRNVSIAGGYDSCSDSTANQLAPSTIRGIGNNQPNVHLSGFANPMAVNVTLTNLRITGGAAPNGAGIRIGGDQRVSLVNVEVSDNEAGQYGGGIYLDGGNGSELIIDYGSAIFENTAHQRGAGVYCKDANSATGGKIDFRRGEIRNNLAGAYGAGLFLQTCDLQGSSSGVRRISDNYVDAVSFDDEESDLVNYEVAGGGVFAYMDSAVTMGSANSETLIDGNRVRQSIHDGFGFHYEEDHGRGGGFYLMDHSQAHLTNAHVSDNLSSEGGAVYAESGSLFELKRDPAGCIANADHPACASIDTNTAKGWDAGYDGCVATTQNFAGRGGALFLWGASATLDGVWVSDNRAVKTDGCAVEHVYEYPHGAAFFMGAAGNLDIVNTVMHDNGNNSADDIIHVNGGASRFRSFHSTIAGNSNVDDAVIRTSDGSPYVGLFNTILMESAKIYENDGASNAELYSVCVLANNLGTLDDAPESDLRDSVQAGNAGFVDGGNDDFRLNNDSPAVDLCVADEVTARGHLPRVLRDVDGDERPRISTVDPDRAWDAGAYENQSGLDAIVADLEVTINDGDFNIGLGASMGYLITLRNNGPDAVANAGFRISLDTRLQNPMTLVPFTAGWTCSDIGYVGECHYSGTLVPGDAPMEVAVQFTSPSSPAIVTSTVEALAPATLVDSTTSNNSASESTSIAIDSDLATRFVTVPSMLEPGQSAEVEVELENIGPDVSPDPRIRLFFPATVLNVGVVGKPSTAWSCTDAIDQGNGMAAITCAANQIGPSTYAFRFGFQVPLGHPAPGYWEMRLAVAQESPESIGNNLAQVNVPVESLTGGPMIFGDAFED